jgi:ribosomal protein S18 acetylase RimI-like enzyme
MDIEIIEAKSCDDALVAAAARLMPQFSSSAPAPSRELIEEIVASSCSTLLLARARGDAGRIVGMLTLVVFPIPTGIRAYIHDVVVDSSARGHGVGERLTREAMRLAKDSRAVTIDLTSRASREAANRLYPRVGFKRHETNLYRLELKS